MEDGGTSVELHILSTHFQKGKSGSREVVCAEK